MIRIKDQWDRSGERFAPGVLVEVTNGKGLLRLVYGEREKQSFLTLLLGDQPLFQLQGDEYFCPTCEKIMKSGYGLEQSKEFKNNVLNGDTENLNLTEMVEGIGPVLGLLKSGYYIIVDTRMYPVDGHGHLFCEMPNTDEYLAGTCPYYYGACEWGNSRPYFTIATQPQHKICPERVQYYKEHAGGRALAFYMDGYMTALLDGHHKTMAAAQMHEMVDALVIMPCYKIWRRDEANQLVEHVGTEEFEWNCADYGLQSQLPEQNDRIGTDVMERMVDSIPKADAIEHNLFFHELAEYYPTVEEVASIDLIGEITDERIENILKGCELPEPKSVDHFVRVLRYLHHSALFEVVQCLLAQNLYCRERYLIVKELTKMEKTDELVDLLIDIMVTYEDDYPEIKDLILDYL